MTEEIDIYRSAKLLIDRHGDEAAIHAAMQADKCLAKNDYDGKATWLRVIETTKELLGQQPPPSSTPLH